ncbi:MAG: MiaB/RimO family radical SAM methylthiotransferase, partial [Bacteroidota bacterium]
MTINLITLGCSKNLVDSEKLLHQLKKSGHDVYHNAETFADAIIINTCGFILDAKTESIESILEYTRAKKEGFIDKLVVIGCLSERYRESLKAEIPEVDAFFGVNEWREIIAFFNGKYYEGQLFKRILSTPLHFAYLKISEGCNRKCSFCAIPSIRGKQVSLPIDQLLKEAQELAAGGAKELILIAQELSNYGLDIYKEKALPELLEKLVKIDAFQWIRFHYIYPDNFPTNEIIKLMLKYPKICKYLDIPVQHANDSVLKRMRRGHNRKDVEQIISG